MSKEGAGYDRASIWVSSIIDTDWPVSIENPIIAGIVWFGTIPNITLVVYWFTNGSAVSVSVIYALSFAIIWLNIGPIFIWYYDERVLPKFFEQLNELLKNEDRVSSLNDKYHNFFCKKYWILPIATTIVFIALFIRYRTELEVIGLAETGGVFFYWFLILGIWLGILVGIGFTGVVTTLLVIRELSKEPINISPLHPDGLGGLSIVGYYAIRTTITFSSGSILLPLMLLFVSAKTSNVIIYFAVFMYMCGIALSFIYPTYKINRKAVHMRNKNLDRLRKEYQEAKERMKSTGNITDELSEPSVAELIGTGRSSSGEKMAEDMGELIGHMELQRIRNDYEDYQNVQLYPFQIDIMIRLMTSVLLPLAFLLVEEFLHTMWP